MAVWARVLLVAILVAHPAVIQAQDAIYGSATDQIAVLTNPISVRDRAATWLEALSLASQNLPNSALELLKQFNAGDNSAKLGLCAAVLPASALTRKIKPVYGGQRLADFSLLNWKDKISALRLVLATFLVAETQSLLSSMRKIWPKDIARAGRDVCLRLEDLAAKLAALWEICLYLEREEALSQSSRLLYLQKLTEYLPHSPLLWFLLARANLGGELPEKAIFAADMALKYCPYAFRPASFAHFFRAEICHVRAQANLASGYLGLARADMDKALQLMRESGMKTESLAQILVGHGEMWRQENDSKAICEDFLQACALGFCSQIARARRMGECNSFTN